MPLGTTLETVCVPLASTLYRYFHKNMAHSCASTTTKRQFEERVVCGSTTIGRSQWQIAAGQPFGQVEFVGGIGNIRASSVMVMFTVVLVDPPELLAQTV